MYQARKGRLTASKHHEINAKINGVLKSKGSTTPKTTPLIGKTMFGMPRLNTHPTEWGIENEDTALKAFYGNEILRHENMKIQTCGIFLYDNPSYTAGSPDGTATCKGHGKILIETEFPYNIKNKTIADGKKECQFLVEKDGLFFLSKTHQCYTPIISQMGITGIHYCYFTVWTMKYLFVEKIVFNEKL